MILMTKLYLIWYGLWYYEPALATVLTCIEILILTMGYNYIDGVFNR